LADRLLELLEPTVNGLGYELLGIDRGRVNAGQLLRIYIDHDDGIGVEDCSRVSHQVSDLLEAEQAIRGEYTLEVSSPGLDRPLFTLEQHRRHLGAGVQMRLRNLVNGRRRLTGTLLEVNGDDLIVEVDGERFAVPFQELERSRLAVDWPAGSGAPAKLRTDSLDEGK
jgi:ribosome maturation factor RimP